MILSHIVLKNWRNFQSVEVDLRDRAFLVGPNACGKSNFLDALRFLRDLAKDGGGLQKAVRDRGGLSKIRCLYARRYSDVEIEVHLSENESQAPTWKYAIGIKQKKGGKNEPVLTYERIWKGERQLVNRPNPEDQKDNLRLTQTYLEQINANAEFREISRFLESISYLYLVPQLLRHPESFSGPGIAEDPFGRSFLERIIKTPEKTRRSRLKKIEEALRVALLESNSLLLLEDPELSLNASITAKLPSLIYRLQKSKKRQMMISTHSADLLSDIGIGGEEVLLMTPTPEGTKVELASSIADIRSLLEGGLSVADAALPRTAPSQIEQLSLLR